MRLSLNRVFCDERWSKNRTVTSMDWSPQFPELLVARWDTSHNSSFCSLLLPLTIPTEAVSLVALA